MLEAKNIFYNKQHKKVLKNISLGLHEGKIIGLLGPNGAGKSTLMQALSGYITLSHGEISIGTKTEREEILIDTTYMNHTLNFSKNWNGEKILEMYRNSRKDFNYQRFMGMVKTLDVDLSAKIKTMSRGEKEKLMLSLTLSQEVQYYFLDEPLTGIDIIAREEILRSLLTFASPEATIIISSHYIDIFEMLFEDVFFINDGEIIANVDPEEIRNDGKTLSTFYKELYLTNGGILREENILGIK